jgi:hypothetical protein
MIGPITKTVGPLVLSLASNGAGVFAAKISLNAQLGGGEATGVLKAIGSLEVDLTLEQALELGFADVNKLVPAAVLPIVEEGEVLAEAAVEKL